MSPELLKETYTIFKQEYRHLSPIHGALVWESGVVKNYYDAGLFAPTAPNQWLPNTDGPIRLSRALFNDTLGNFDISNNPNYPARHLGISTIASIIAYLELHRQHKYVLDNNTPESLIIRDIDFALSVGTVDQAYDATQAEYKKRIEECKAQGLKDQAYQLGYSQNKALQKLDTKRLYRDWTRNQSMAQIRTRIAEIDQLTGKEKSKSQKERAQLVRQYASLESAQPGGDYNRVHEMACAIMDAHNPSIYYPPYIAEWLLMACMYRKAKTKQDLVSYISLLTHNIGQQVCGNLDDSWYLKTYVAADCDSIKQKISAMPSLEEPALYEDIAYAQIIEHYYKGPVPKIAEYMNITIKGFVFPDCMEITLLHLCNMILYERVSGTFNIHRAPHKPSQLLIDFYADKIHTQATHVGLETSHQAWGSLLQNWPYITYRSAILNYSSSNRAVLVAPKDTNGFIRGLSKDIVEKLEHKDNRVRIAGHWYIHRDEPDTYLCEMHPTIRNFIIVLDQLFDLKMFTDTPLPIAFMSDRFNATFFPLLCKHVELLHNTVLNDTILTSLDQDEHTEHGVRIACPTFDLILTDEHAEIITHTKGNTIADLAPHIIHRILHTPDSQKRWQYAQLLSVFPFEPQQLPADKPGAYLLYLPLYDIQTKIKAALFCIQKLSEQTASEADRTYYTDKAINFIRQLPERLDWHYHEQLIRTMDGRVLAYAPIAAEIERIMATAQARMTGDSAACEYVPNLYIALINKGQKRTDVLPIVNNIIARTDSFDRRPLLNLLILLAQQGQAVQQSRKAVEICINNSIEAERMLAQTLNEILLKQ